MPNIELNSDELSTLITTLEIEEYRINHYYDALMHCNNIEISSYDKERIAKINALVEKLKKEQGRVLNAAIGTEVR